uniref:Uncharacterized protein n=1 Tax=Lotus japonicus TaxID=34305 RepID=I3STI0_LOTJA|nr:unknown [Lotus japonicus]
MLIILVVVRRAFDGHITLLPSASSVPANKPKNSFIFRQSFFFVIFVKQSSFSSHSHHRL